MDAAEALTRPVDEELAGDRAQQAAWLAELRRVGLLGDDPDVEQIVTALHEYLGRTPSSAASLYIATTMSSQQFSRSARTRRETHQTAG